MPEPIAIWNSARGVWEQSGGAPPLFRICEHSVVFSETWPISGSMRSGRAFPPRPSAPRTSASGSSSSPGLATGFAPEVPGGRLLKTPTGNLGSNGGSQHPDKRRSGGHGPTLADEVEHLLPTPRASDGEKGGPNPRGGDLNEAVSLLPTPTATPYGNNQSPSPGAAVRPSLESLAPTLAPPVDAACTPTTLEGSVPSAVPAPIPNSDAPQKLLPTPRASDTGTPGRRASEGYRPPLSQVVLPLLPTPDATHGRKSTRTGPLLPGVVETLLPTPTVEHSARNATANRTDPKPTTDVTGWTLQDVFWAGDPTPPPSNAGKRSSAARRPVQLTIADA